MVVTDPHTNTQTHRQDRLQYTVLHLVCIVIITNSYIYCRIIYRSVQSYLDSQTLFFCFLSFHLQTLTSTRDFNFTNVSPDSQPSKSSDLHTRLPKANLHNLHKTTRNSRLNTDPSLAILLSPSTICAHSFTAIPPHPISSEPI